MTEVDEAEALGLEAPAKRKRQKSPHNRVIAAMAAFARVLEDEPENSRRAAIGWLADKYLNVKLWDRW